MLEVTFDVLLGFEILQTCGMTPIFMLEGLAIHGTWKAIHTHLPVLNDNLHNR